MTAVSSTAVQQPSSILLRKRATPSSTQCVMLARRTWLTRESESSWTSVLHTPPSTASSSLPNSRPSHLHFKLGQRRRLPHHLPIHHKRLQPHRHPCAAGSHLTAVAQGDGAGTGMVVDAGDGAHGAGSAGQQADEAFPGVYGGHYSMSSRW